MITGALLESVKIPGVNGHVAAVSPAMPVFRDIVGSSYEVRGVEGERYNLLSSPRLSINAEFTSAPQTFQVRCSSPAPTHAIVSDSHPPLLARPQT